MMRILFATAVLTATSTLACATQTLGPGGTGGTGADGGTTTTTTSTGGSTTTTSTGGSGGTGGSLTGGSGGSGGSTTTTTTSSGTTTEDLCGNGVKDPGEQCDLQDFGGKTCASIGFEGGKLQCNNFCAIVASGCTPPENCSNGQDEDMDGQIDCLDSDCSQQPVCLDSCAEPIVVTLPSFTFSDTTGRPAVQTSSCSAAAGSELVYQFTATETVDMTVTVFTFGGSDFTVSVRTACADIASEIHCENKFGPNDFQNEEFLLPVVQGQTYFVIVDGTSVNDFGFFELDLQVPQPEFDFQCNDHDDNDFDGYLDCDDPSDCQASFNCMPGNQPPGAQCFSNNDCAATGNDPICLFEQEGFADGYCSEFCDLANPTCAGDGICVDPLVVVGKQISVNGICLDTCASIADCRPGYDCVDRGLASLVCIVAPESSCKDFQDNDIDTLIDCQDPDCQLSPSCVPGAKATGQPCLDNTECFANPNDPVCLTEGFFGYPGGYCSQFCDGAPNSCGGGALCVQGWVALNAAVCLDICNVQNDCRPGYSCLDIGFPSKVCVF